MELEYLIIAIVSYLLGCFNMGYYYVRLFYKKDIRRFGTNVTGAYNVSRIAGKKGFIITFAADAAKGAFAVLLSRMIGWNDTMLLLSILMVLLGHIFPFQLNFRGGKGLSTALGAFLAFSPVIVGFWLITFLCFLPFIRKYTVSCLSALALLPLELFVANYSEQTVYFFVAYSIVILYACRYNLIEYIKIRAYYGSKKNNKNE